MAKRGGIKKGSPFEREISKELSWWWSWGERSDLVWRTSQSGGRATERSKTNQITQYQHGDLCPIHDFIYPLFDFFLFELKRGYNKDIDILDHIDLPDHRVTVPILMQWWNKAEGERKESGRCETMLILQRDGRRKLVVTSQELMIALRDITKESFRPLYRIDVGKLTITRFEDFFNYLEPEHLKILPQYY